MKFEPHPYQEFAIQHIIKHPISTVYTTEANADFPDSTVSGALFLDMGLGKTACTLTAVSELLDSGEVRKVLITAPLRVARDTWTDEIAKWDHTRHLRASKILGTEKQRIEGLRAKADIYLINRENIVWLITFLGGAWPFDMVVMDELSSYKSNKAARFKALKQVRPKIIRAVGLTGTPAPNGLLDLWPQLFLLDRGQRLGKNITPYRDAYFHAPYRNQGQVISGYKLAGENPTDLDKNPNAKAIFAKIKDICISMQAKDWLQLPERIDTVTNIHLSDGLMQKYKDFERDKVMEMMEAMENSANGGKITAVNAAALTNKLLQFANGAVYVDDKHNYEEIHNEKIEALGERIEAANGNPILVAYTFQSDLKRIQHHLKSMKPRLLSSTKDMVDWNAGKIPFALGHPQSLGHGLNLQQGGHLMEWFGLCWSLEFYLQFVARIARQGQKHSVTNNRLLTVGTMDFKVLDALAGKNDGQNSLMEAVKALIKQYKK